MDVRVGPWKKTECWRINAFELWCCRRLLKVPWTAQRSNQSILKEINPEYSLEGLMMKLKLQYFGHFLWIADSLEKDPNAGKGWRQEEKGMTEDEMVRWHHWLSGHEFEQTPRDGSTGKPGMLQSMGSPRVGHKRATEQHMTPKTTVCKKYTTPSANKLLLTSASKAILKVNSLSPKYRLNCFWIMRVKIVVLP